MVRSQKNDLWRQIFQYVVLVSLLSVVGFSHAEMATAADQDAETVVVGKILKDQQAVNQNESTTPGS